MLSSIDLHHARVRSTPPSPRLSASSRSFSSVMSRNTARMPPSLTGLKLYSMVRPFSRPHVSRAARHRHARQARPGSCARPRSSPATGPESPRRAWNSISSRAGTPGCTSSGGNWRDLDPLLAHELQPHVLVEQRHAVAHVVERRLHDLARALGFGGALLHLVEQAQRLDGDHGLVGEGRRSARSARRERPRLSRVIASTPIGVPSRISGIPSIERYSPNFCGPAQVYSGIGLDVRNMHDRAIEHGPAAQRIAARRHALLEHEIGQLAANSRGSP